MNKKQTLSAQDLREALFKLKKSEVRPIFYFDFSFPFIHKGWMFNPSNTSGQEIDHEANKTLKQLRNAGADRKPRSTRNGEH